jgi:hypothetical protein
MDMKMIVAGGSSVSWDSGCRSNLCHIVNTKSKREILNEYSSRL